MVKWSQTSGHLLYLHGVNLSASKRQILLPLTLFEMTKIREAGEITWQLAYCYKHYPETVPEVDRTLS